MSENEKRPLCPLSMCNSREDFEECRQGRCAWWSSVSDSCAVLLLAQSVYDVECLLSMIKAEQPLKKG